MVSYNHSFINTNLSLGSKQNVDGDDNNSNQERLHRSETNSLQTNDEGNSEASLAVGLHRDVVF